MPLRRVESDASVVPPVTRRKCARNAASTCGKCADCTRSSQERQSSGPATGSGTPRRILRSLRNRRGRSCKFTTNPVFCATGACRWRGRRPLAPLTLRGDVPDSGRAQDRQPAPPSGPADQELGFVVNLQHFHVSLSQLAPIWRPTDVSCPAASPPHPATAGGSTGASLMRACTYSSPRKPTLRPAVDFSDFGEPPATSAACPDAAGGPPRPPRAWCTLDRKLGRDRRRLRHLAIGL